MRKRMIVIFLLVLLFLVASGLLLLRFERDIEDGFLELIGNSAVDFAAHLASDTRLSDADVESLKSTVYSEVVNGELNKRLEESLLSTEHRLSIRGVYLFYPLTPEEIVYTVDEDTAGFFAAPVGTPLDVMWLLNVEVQPDELTASLMERGVLYDDIYRYSYIREIDREILAARECAYALRRDEWGEMITGYAPIYSAEGTFIGMLGVDVFTRVMFEPKADAMRGVLVVYGASTTLLCALFLFVYRKYLRVRRDQLYRDPLTSAYNRRYFNEMFRESLRVRRNIRKYLSVLMLDIDHFKQINDDFGHDKGDLCLKAIAEAITSVLHEPPNILVRYGGEEFLAIMTVDDKGAAESMIDEILKRVRELNLFDGRRKVTISGGAAILPYADVDKTDLHFVIKRADDNLYYCKNNGRNRFKLTDYTDTGINAAGGARL